MEEKKDNNNKLEIVTSFQERSQVLVKTQKTLFGKPDIKRRFRLNKNQFILLELFSNNEYTKFSRNFIYYNITEKVHMNTISNFLKFAESNDLVKRQRIIPGAYINTLFFEKRMPDKFEDGTICKDKRATYYKITKLGMEVFELNEKM